MSLLPENSIWALRECGILPQPKNLKTLPVPLHRDRWWNEMSLALTWGTLGLKIAPAGWTGTFFARSGIERLQPEIPPVAF